MLLSYLRLVLFAAGLLIGVQVPGLINDYAKRVEAHLIEAQALRGFQADGEQFFKGDLQALVRITAPATTRCSQRCRQPEPADPPTALDNNGRRCKARGTSAPASGAGRRPGHSQETWNGYSYQILLTPEAMIWGMSAGLLLSFGLECLFAD
jgi:hypothetical protein